MVYPAVVQNQHWLFNSQNIAETFDFGEALLKIFGFHGFIMNFIKNHVFRIHGGKSRNISATTEIFLLFGYCTEVVARVPESERPLLSP